MAEIKVLILVAPYCAPPRDYLSDSHTPISHAMGFWVSQHLRSPTAGHNNQKNPRAHKNKIGPPPQKKQKTPPKTRNFMGMEVFLQKERNFARRP